MPSPAEAIVKNAIDIGCQITIRSAGDRVASPYLHHCDFVRSARRLVVELGSKRQNLD